MAFIRPGALSHKLYTVHGFDSALGERYAGYCSMTGPDVNGIVTCVYETGRGTSAHVTCTLELKYDPASATLLGDAINGNEEYRVVATMTAYLNRWTAEWRRAEAGDRSPVVRQEILYRFNDEGQEPAPTVIYPGEKAAAVFRIALERKRGPVVAIAQRAHPFFDRGDPMCYAVQGVEQGQPLELERGKLYVFQLDEPLPADYPMTISGSGEGGPDDYMVGPGITSGRYVLRAPDFGPEVMYVTCTKHTWVGFQLRMKSRATLVQGRYTCDWCGDTRQAPEDMIGCPAHESQFCSPACMRLQGDSHDACDY